MRFSSEKVVPVILSERRKHENRREFLKTGLALSGSVLGSASSALCALGPQSSRNSKIFIARDENLRAGGERASPLRLLDMLDRVMLSLCERASPVEAWQRLVKPGQVVGLKVNGLAGRGISTTPELVEVICERLQEAGVKSSHIVIWDRLNKDLERAGFGVVEKGRGPRCFGNDYLGFEPNLMTFNKVGSLVCRTLTEVCDVVINLPVLKDHGITGMTGAMKNLFGAIHNPNKYHLNTGDPYVADVYMLPPIREKVRLILCDALTAQYEGGPSYMPHWTWPYNGIIGGFDPVAMDFTGWQIVESKRRQAGMPSLKEAGREPTYIATAADREHGLGVCGAAGVTVLEV